ncbi:unnamed protein product [Alternaria sp. RS040]
MHLITHSKFIDSHQPAMSIVPTAAWQSVLLSYNLMSATSPLLKGFTEGFMTAGTSLGYVQEGATTGGGSGTLGSYELRSLTKTKSKPTASKATSNDDLRYYNENASIASHDSRRIMIKREWKVSRD